MLRTAGPPYFYPRSPRGERRAAGRRGGGLPAISIHAPREGSDTLRDAVDRRWDISIHAPREGSDGLQQPRRQARPISIHAPREGSDAYLRIARRQRRKFLSTLPARGATPFQLLFVVPLLISIHAPREGSDVRGQMIFGPLAGHFYPRSPRGERRGEPVFSRPPADFYPRSPRGERPACARTPGRNRPISIHAPREGSDRVVQHYRPGGVVISIHAPREGSDGNRRRKRRLHSISIHAPREGSDLPTSFSMLPALAFLSTLPARGATRQLKGQPAAAGFLSTLPARGATERWD